MTGTEATVVPATARRWSLRRWAMLMAIFAALLTLASIGGGGFAIWQLRQARANVVDRLDPAIRSSLRLNNALVNQETGIRGYALSAQRDFLTPYTDGKADEAAAVADLKTSLGDRFPTVSADLTAVQAASDRWHAEYAEPTIAAVETSGMAQSQAEVQRGKALFDAMRVRLDPLDAELQAQQVTARQALDRYATILTLTGIGIGLVLLIGTIVLITGLIRGIIRPLGRIGTDVRAVASGDFTHDLSTAGPQEVRDLAADVESMRERILAELAAVRDMHTALAAQATELRRSNQELEQFAYVASHDLQEPLRKVASFCELLEARYGDSLDDRGRQYIGFAVDGAMRMQALINDLLAFSRVGRANDERVPVDLNAIFATATGNLASSIDETGATVTADRLPVVNGDAGLLTLVFQNLIANAIKFRRPDHRPRIEFGVRERGDFWELTCEDNGIGIEPDYADRIFVIFQRLHPKSAYPGTGIGLAMCRKIIEFHGGQIWLDRAGSAPGSRFRFTLPRRTADDIRLAIAQREEITTGRPS